ncbi:MAG: SDR family NAD(P)-dependent oxidoreductase, partial [Candidatus Saccharimonadales bacterium]
PCDITDTAAVEVAAAAIASCNPELSGVINNAALAEPPHGAQPLLRTTPAQWQALLATNLTGAWLVTRAAVPQMARTGALRALFVTSEAGWAFTPSMGPYNVSKAALNNLGASFAEECAAAFPELDVQMNVLVAGEAATEMNRGSAISPYAIVSMALALLAHPRSGPNGRFFHRDGRHLGFAYAAPYERSLFDAEAGVPREHGLLGRVLRGRV